MSKLSASRGVVTWRCAGAGEGGASSAAASSMTAIRFSIGRSPFLSSGQREAGQEAARRQPGAPVGTAAAVNYLHTVGLLGFVRGGSMRIRNTTLALLAVAAGAPSDAQTRLAGGSVPPHLYAAAAAAGRRPAAPRTVPRAAV